MKNAVKHLHVLLVLIGLVACDVRAQAVSPRDLLEVADISDPVLSPDGTLVVFRVEQPSIERNTYDSVWYVQDINGASPPHRVADGGVPLRDSAGAAVPSIAQWSPDGQWIHYRARIYEKIDVWRAAVDGSSAEPVTLDAADVRDFTLSADGAILKYSVGATRDEVMASEEMEYEQGIRVDNHTPIGQPLFRSGNIEGRLATQRFGTWFNRVSLLADVPDQWKAVTLATGKRRNLTPAEVLPKPIAGSDLAKGLAKPWKVADDAVGQRFALLTRVGEKKGQADSPDVRLSVIRKARSQRPVVCVADPCSGRAITNIQWRPDSDEVIFTVTDPDQGLAQSIFRWNVQTGLVLPVARSTGLLNGGRDPSEACGMSAAVMACVTAKADQPPRLESVDLETGRRQVLFDPNAALAKAVADSVQVRLLRWTDQRGRRFTGQYFPARASVSGTPSPLFVTYYSCYGFLRGGFGDEWPLASFAQKGISALCINHVLGYTLDAVERYDEGLAAVESVVDLLAGEGQIDRTRVGMGGLSFGSEVAMWVAMKSNRLCAVSVTSPLVSPIYSLIGSLKGDAFYSGLRRNWQLGSIEETREQWQVLSPVFNLDRIRAPILMQMPEQEYLMALDYAIPLMRKHRADLYVFPNEPHQKFQPRHKLVAYERNMDWFRFWLQGYEDEDREKSEQYARWRAMRTAISSAPKDIDAGMAH